MDTFNMIIRHAHRKLYFLRRSKYGLAIFLPVYFGLHTYAQIKKKEVSKNLQATAPVGYLISLGTCSATVSHQVMIQAAFKITGHWLLIMGIGNDSINTDLVIVPAAGKDMKELTAQLQAIPDVSNVSVVALSKPVKSAELPSVRKLLAGFNLNAGTVSDKQLSLFLNSKLDGQYTYYIDQDRKQNLNGLHNMFIKRVEDHPQYSPAWRKDMVIKQQDTTLVSDILEVHDVVVQIIEEVEPPSPPPPAPVNMSKMSNAQIRRWMRKNDSRNLKDKDIQINRTAEEVVIAIKLKEGTETLHYKIKK